MKRSIKNKIRFKNKYRIFKNKFKKNIVPIFFLIIAFCPLIVDLIYACFCRKFSLAGKDIVLNYYGVVFGIFMGYLSISRERKDNKCKINLKLKPHFKVEITPLLDKTFNIKITNQTENLYESIYLFDAFIAQSIKSEETIEKEFKIVDNTYEQITNTGIPIVDWCEYLDSNEKLQYIQILCDDIYGNTWGCEFNIIKDSVSDYYCKDPELI